MSQVRVFELAKELNMPAKQLLTKVRKAGIPATGNFSELSIEQAEVVRKLANTDKGIVIPKLKNKKIVKNKKETSSKKLKNENHNSQDDDKDSEIVTISTKSQLGISESDELPKRRVRRKRDKTESSTYLEDNIKTENKSLFEKKGIANNDKLDNKKEDRGNRNSREFLANKNLNASKLKNKENQELGTDGYNKVNTFKQSRKKGRYSNTIKPFSIDNLEDTSISDIEDNVFTERKSKKKKIIFKKSGYSEDDIEGNNKNSNRLYGDKKQRGSGNEQRDFTYRERKPRNRRKAGSQKHNHENLSKNNLNSEETTKHVFNPRKKSIRIGNQVAVGELASLIGIKVPEILKKLMTLGTMATINQTISGETAELIAADFDITVEVETFELSDLLKEQEPRITDLEIRAPIVTIMGHVDHGKTSLLDKIRESRVATGEAGGITQHIGAYHLKAGGNRVTFLDTPGHEAFTSMRARGANITDIVVLVVASDDKVQPQTIEAIHHARAADVPIIVAINKIDRPESDPLKIQQELLGQELIPEDLGGNTIFVKVSAKTGDGIDELLEMIHLQSEILELKSTPLGLARGTIIESRLRKGQGSVGTVLVQRGTLKVGDNFVIGGIHGKIRTMFDEIGNNLEEAGPSIPVEISGLSSVPEVGELFVVLEDEKKARLIAEEREYKLRAENITKDQKTSLDNLFNKIEEGQSNELRLILKGDVQGSVEALKSSLEQLGDDRISPRFLLCSVGNVNETDISLASASDAIIVGFNVQMDAKAREARVNEGVDVRLYDIIYNALDDVKLAMEGLLEPEIREEVLGHLEVKQVFSSGKNGIVVGGLVTDGKLLRNSLLRVIRNKENIFEGSIISLKRFKDDVQEVLQNYECGMVLDFEEIENGDIIEVYQQIQESPRL